MKKKKVYSTLSSLPNLLTLVRIGLIPVIFIAFYTQSVMGQWVATITFMVACLTDFLDGYIARVLSQTSQLGKILDPLADKILVASTLFLLAAFQHMSFSSLIPCLIILCREILVSGLRGSLRIKLPVSYLAKWKTTFQMISMSCLMISGVIPFQGIVQGIGEVFLWIAAVLTLLSAIGYIRSIFQKL